MKGVVFVELMDFLEAQFGYALVDQLIQQAALPSEGAYTRVGTYPHTEVVALVKALAAHLGAPAADLYKAFGEHLFGRLAASHPELMGEADALAFLRTIQDHIHVEVQKLYPEAELPRFDYAADDDADRVTMTYRSQRGFGDLAEGLIHGCLAHYAVEASVERADLGAGDGTQVRFTIQR